MEAPKVTLSEAELRLITNASLILTKNAVIDKTCKMFGNLGNYFQSRCTQLKISHPGIFGPHAKISKGEKHKDLPWVMVDYPRCFDKELGHLAIRCFCWWGNYFSIHLQVSGTFLPAFVQELPKWTKEDDQWYAGFTTDPWDMELPNAGWSPVQSEENIPGLINETVFLKLAKKIPIEEWEQAEEKLSRYFDRLISLAEPALMHRSGETAL